MHDTGYETEDYDSPCPAGGKKRPMKTVYPEVHLRANEDGELPPIPDGESYAVIRIAKVGYRNPVDEKAEPSCDIAVMGIMPIAEDQAESLMGDMDDEPGAELKRGLRRSLAKKMEAGYEDE